MSWNCIGFRLVLYVPDDYCHFHVTLEFVNRFCSLMRQPLKTLLNKHWMSAEGNILSQNFRLILCRTSHIYPKYRTSIVANFITVWLGDGGPYLKPSVPWSRRTHIRKCWDSAYAAGDSVSVIFLLLMKKKLILLAKFINSTNTAPNEFGCCPCGSQL